MTEDRSGPVTGIAKGSLGTGTALDDTQVYQVADLAPPPVGSSPPIGPVQPVATPGPPSVRRRAAPSTGFPGGAWIGGTAVVAMIATVLVIGGLGSQGPGPGQASSAPAAAASLAAVPSAAPSEAAGGSGSVGGNGHGGGKGNGHGGGGH